MEKIFAANYEGHDIRVRNTWFNGEQLYVNDELQDENLGFALRATLYGRIKHSNEVIKATLGGNLKTNCKIFVNHKPIQVKVVK